MNNIIGYVLIALVSFVWTFIAVWGIKFPNSLIGKWADDLAQAIHPCKECGYDNLGWVNITSCKNCNNNLN